MTNPHNHSRLIIILIAITLVWGASWVSAKHLSMNMPLVELTFWRFIVTAIFSYIALLFFGQKSITTPKASFVWLLAGGVAMACTQLANFAGLKIGTPGLASVIFNAINPMLTFILAIFVFKIKVLKKDIFALLLGAFGVAMIFNIWNFSGILKIGNFYFFLNALFFAFVTLIAQFATRTTSAIIFSFYMGIFGAIVILPFCSYDAIMSVFNKDYIFWLNLIFMAGISGGFCTAAYFYIVGKLGSATSSSFIFLVPIGSYIAGYFAYNEIIDLITLIGGFCALLAVYIINKKS